MPFNFSTKILVMQSTTLRLNYERTDNPKIISHTTIRGVPSLGKHKFVRLNTCQHTVLLTLITISITT